MPKINLDITGHTPEIFFNLRLGDVKNQAKSKQRQDLAEKIAKADQTKLDQINNILK